MMVSVIGGIATLALGHGAAAAPVQDVISTAAGDGTRGFVDGPADSAQFKELEAVATTADGGFLVVDAVGNRIRKVSPPPLATVTAVAGDGTLCASPTSSCGDGGMAISAQLNVPTGVAEARDGSILIADTGNNRIRRVQGNIITTVAGDGRICQQFIPHCGDGFLATQAQLNGPTGVAAHPDGGFLIADYRNMTIRRVSGGSSPRISTIAGNGQAGFSGDNVAATATRLYFPSGVALTKDGGFLIADNFNHRVRAVSPGLQGKITTIAGTGVQCLSGSPTNPPQGCGDGGNARSASLNGPKNVTVTPDGDILIADYGSHRIRKVVAGTIRTVAGTGFARSSGDGGLAISADLNGPSGVAATPDGGFLVTDRFGFKIRQVSAPIPVTVALRSAGACPPGIFLPAILGLSTGGPGPLDVQATSSNSVLVPSSGVTFAAGSVRVRPRQGLRIGGRALLTITVTNQQRSQTLPVMVTLGTPTALTDRLTGAAQRSNIMLGFADFDVLGGRGEIDLICGGEGNDILTGAAGDDILDGGEGNDRVVGHSGHDSVRGAGGNDYLAGGKGDDGVFGGSGDDELDGGAGDDVLVGGPGADYFRGGPGDDEVADFDLAEGDFADATVP